MNQEVHEILGLQSNPFPPGACRDFYFQTDSTKEIMEQLLTGITARKGFLMLVGEVGLGKTSLLLQLVPRLESAGVRTSMVSNTLLNKTELLAAIAREYAINVPDAPHLAELLDTLHGFFLETSKNGQNCAIIIDEAHLLNFQAMEVLRMLSNLEKGGEKLVQILLVGQPELRQKLDQPEMRQLRSRINVFQELPPLSSAQVGEYVNFKLSQAGSDLRLEGRALRIVREISSGNCRRINLLLEKALYALVASGEQRLTSTVILEGLREIAAWDSDLAGKLRRLQLRRFATLLASALAGGLALGIVLMFWQPWSYSPSSQPVVDEEAVFVPETREGGASEQKSEQDSAAEAGKTVVESEPLVEESQDEASPAGGSELSTDASAPEVSVPEASAPEVARSEAEEPASGAGEEAVQEPQPVVESELAVAARKFLQPWGLEKELRDVLYDAVRHNKPQDFARALAEAANPEQMPLQIVPLERKPTEKDYKLTTFPWRRYSDFGPAWLVLWRPPASMKHYGMDVSSPDIVALQERLDLLGYYRMGIDGTVGAGTWKAVQLFQRDHGLEQTGIPDAETLFWLFNTDKKARPGTAVVNREEEQQDE